MVRPTSVFFCLSTSAAGGNVTSQGDTCNDIMDCFTCASTASWEGTCHWCPKDGACHAFGSLMNTCSSTEQVVDPAMCSPLPPTIYDQSRALLYANLAGAAYCSQASLESWSCGSKCSAAAVSSVSVCEGYHIKAFVGNWESKCLVSFEGTADTMGWVKDLEAFQTGVDWPNCDGCKVHQGFFDEYHSLKSCIETELANKGCGVGSSIRTTGHSLGAAVNSIAMMELTAAGWTIEESYDFGKPRVGNTAFAKAHGAVLQGRAFRVTHASDPVPQCPPTQLLGPQYQHVEPEIWYWNEVGDGYVTCFEDNHESCAEQHWNVPIDLLHIADHSDYMGLETGGAGCVGDVVEV